MTHRTDLERVLDIWLADGPEQVPDIVFDETVARVYHAPQRSHWRLRWRDLNVSTRLLAASIAIVAIVGVGIYVISPSFAPGPGVLPTIAPSPTSAPTSGVAATRPPVSCVVDGTPREPCRGRMEAGTYNLASPLVPFSVTVPAGWVNRMNLLGGAMLEREGDPIGTAIFVWSDPVVADQSTCTQGPDRGYGRRAQDIVAFLTGNAALETSTPQTAELGGLKGSRLDVSARTGPFVPCADRVQMFVHADTINDGFWWDISGDRRMAVWILDAGDGHTVLVNVEAPQSAFGAFLEAATPIVESMQFTRQAACVDGSPCLGVLAPGTYTTGELEVPLTFTVPEGWSNDWDMPLGYALIPTGDASKGERGIFIFLDVYASTQVSCARQPATGVGRGAADLVAWLGSLPDLTATTPAAVTVGGLSGFRTDVSVTSGGPVCRPGDYQLWVSDYQPLWWGITPGDPHRHYVLDLPGRHNVLVLVTAHEAEFDDFTKAARPIIESFEFAP